MKTVVYVPPTAVEWAEAMIRDDGLCQLTRRDWILPRPCSQQAKHVLRVILDAGAQDVCVCRDCFANIVEEMHEYRFDQAQPVRLRAE